MFRDFETVLGQNYKHTCTVMVYNFLISVSSTWQT